MLNMGYCRFENTAAAAAECAAALENGAKLSASEKEAYGRLVETCRNIVEFDESADADELREESEEDDGDRAHDLAMEEATI